MVARSLIIFIFSFLVLGIIVKSCEQESVVSAQADQSQITNKIISLSKELKFKVLSRGDFGGKGINLQILVPESTSKDMALAIAKKIRAEFPGIFLDVGIYDSREAYNHKYDNNYPENKFMKHYLVQLNVNPTTGFNEIRWVAEGRK